MGRLSSSVRAVFKPGVAIEERIETHAGLIEQDGLTCRMHSLFESHPALKEARASDVDFRARDYAAFVFPSKKRRDDSPVPSTHVLHVHDPKGSLIAAIHYGSPATRLFFEEKETRPLHLDFPDDSTLSGEPSVLSAHSNQVKMVVFTKIASQREQLARIAKLIRTSNGRLSRITAVDNEGRALDHDEGFAVKP